MDCGQEWKELLERQHGVVSRQQALECGISDGTVEARLRSRRWQRMQRGVYGTFSGAPGRPACLWAAVLRAGEGAVLSHETAAELDGLAEESDRVIHVSVPPHRRVRSVAGMRVHVSGRIDRARHPVRLPPRTRIEETVLDLASMAATLDTALSWLTRACSRRLTTAARLHAALVLRPKQPWRAELGDALGDVGSGAHSLLELRYLSKVERPHGLPVGERQRVVRRGTRRQYKDVHYREQRTTVELDGRVGHADEGRWRDMRRDNADVVDGEAVLRYGLADVDGRPCEAALQVALVLRRRGWQDKPRPCGPRCPIREHFPYS